MPLRWTRPPSCRRRRKRHKRRSRTSRSPGRLKCWASQRPAMAMPTLLPHPWPSGPVVVSTPEVRWYSGWPGHLLPSWRNRLMSSSETAGSPRRSSLALTAFTPARCSSRVQQHRGMPVGQHEAVAVWPDRIVGIEAQELLPERIDHRRQRHRRAGMAGIGLLHGIHRERANGVDAKLIDCAILYASASRCLRFRFQFDCHRMMSRDLGGGHAVHPVEEETPPPNTQPGGGRDGSRAMRDDRRKSVQNLVI